MHYLFVCLIACLFVCLFACLYNSMTVVEGGKVKQDERSFYVVVVEVQEIIPVAIKLLFLLFLLL